MKGFFNAILRIDLASRKYKIEDISDDLLSKTLGGKGLGSYFLLKENPQGVDPLSPKNIFIIAPGPVTGTRMWSHSRFGAFTKSPATGGYAESYCGGTIAPKIKGSGVDAVLITGKAESLTYLVVDENGVSFRDASNLKGTESYEAEKRILADAPEDARAMVIGPAGENLVACACVKVDRWRSLGRGGFGAVLGSKNLKGIAFAGTLKCEIADDELLKQVTKIVTERGKNSPVTQIYQNYGTPNQIKVTNAHKCFPTRYWKSGYFDQWEKISADYMQEHFDVKSVGCPTCFLRCGKHSTIKEGRHAGLTIDGPEFETIYAIGGLNAIDSLEEITWLNDLCDRWGIDTMSAGNLSALAIEAYKAGKIDYDIAYNQPDKVAEFFRMITFREGVGDVFAKGIKQAATELGIEDMAVHVKGLEPGGFDPRVLKGMGLSYATASRGACHLRGTFYKAELSGEMPKDQIEGKAELHIDYEDRAAIFDTLVLCRFFRDFITWEDLLMLVEGTTGMKMTKDQLAGMANTITNMTREYNVREGLDSSTDTLPKAFIEEANEEGARLTNDELDTMIREYNTLRKR